MNNLDVFRSQPRDTKIKIHGRDAFEGMARAGQLASRALDMLVPHVKPGATTERLTSWSSVSLLGIPVCGTPVHSLRLVP